MAEEQLATQTKALSERLVAHVATYESCLVAYSGGVDSAVVAKAAQLALGNRAMAVTGVSASLATGERDIAERLAHAIGIRHEFVTTDELEDEGYLQNAPNRCWHCKTELYTQLEKLRVAHSIEVIANGTNTDDLGDFRPGLQAAAEHRVRSPLAECGLTKQQVRQVAREWNLEVWDKPATPCLSSRVVYGLDITPERLARIDAAEGYLRSLGFTNFRVRCHHDELARLEVMIEELERFTAPKLREKIATRLRELGFRYITLDLEGFRTGSFQQLISAEELGAYGGER